MKKFIRLFCTAVLFAAVVTISNGKEALAAEIPSSAVTIDYENQKMIIYEGSGQDKDLEIFVAFPTIKTVKKKNASGVTEKCKVMSQTTWDIYDYDKAKGVAIDLSWLNRKKDNYIQLKGDKNSEPVTIKIPAVLTKVSASFDAAAAVVSLKDTTNKKQPKTITDKPIEYKTQYGNWNAYTGNEGGLSMYQMRGATLQFRLAAHGREVLSVTDPAPDLSDMVDTEGKGIQVYEAGSFPGVEMKVAIKKRAAAPKITVDYGKHQFNMPKDTEYRIVTANKISKWRSVNPDTKKVALSEIASDIEGVSAVLEVRTKAVGAKPCSLIGRLSFEMPSVLQIYTLEENTAPDQMIENDILQNGVGVDASACEVNAGYVYKQSTKKLTAIRFFNTTSDVYEVFISKDGEVPTPASKVHTIRAKTSNNKVEAETEITTKYVKNGDKIYIRKKADAKNKVWSSYFAGFGTVDFGPQHIIK